MDSKIAKFLVEKKIWEALDHATYWNGYGECPANVTEFNEHVLCSIQAHDEEKLDLFRAIDGVKEFFGKEELAQFMQENPAIFESE